MAQGHHSTIMSSHVLAKYTRDWENFPVEVEIQAMKKNIVKKMASAVVMDESIHAYREHSRSGKIRIQTRH